MGERGSGAGCPYMEMEETFPIYSVPGPPIIYIATSSHRTPLSLATPAALESEIDAAVEALYGLAEAESGAVMRSMV